MIIKYKNADGEVVDIDVDDKFGKWYLAFEKEEANRERKYRYWVRTSLDALPYEGEWFKSTYETPVEYAIRKGKEERLNKFLSTLTEVQRRRLELLADGLSAREVARLEHVNLKSILETKKQIKAKAMVFYGRRDNDENY